MIKKKQLTRIRVEIQCFKIVPSNENIHNKKLLEVFIVSETALAFFLSFLFNYFF